MITEWSFNGLEALEEVHLKKGIKKFDFSLLEECKEVTIYAPAGSFAQKFAEENGLKFVSE